MPRESNPQAKALTITPWPEIKFSNDATSCYDRIIPSISNIIALASSLHHNIAEIHGSMLERAFTISKPNSELASGPIPTVRTCPFLAQAKVVAHHP